VAVITADDSAYRAAADLHAAGVTVVAVVDLRPKPGGEAVESVRALRIPIHAGMTIGGAAGRRRIDSVRLADGKTIIACDTVLMSGGWTPSAHLMAQARGQSQAAIGACAGIFDLAACLRDGPEAGGSEPGTFSVAGLPYMAPPTLPAAAMPHPKAFVDYQNDVTSQDLATATAEGFVSIEHVKRYTTTGMATDQGKTSNLNAAATVAALTEQDIAAVGLTTFRPPYTPVTFGAFAGVYRGDLFAPVRTTPIATADAVLEDVGNWKRARCYPRAGETIATAVARECLAVRNDAGIADASTLGKIEVCGPDAAVFLSRIYTGDFTALEPGRCRYALLLGEDGFVRDDGIVSRLASDRFHVTTTTGGAAFVLQHMEDYLQTEFSGLRVWLTSVTEQSAVIAVQGPRSPEVLGAFIPDLEAMRPMDVREDRFGDVPVRLFRAGFTGETGFELNLPPDAAQRVWDTLRQQDVTPYGTDAMHVLRAEKGYIVIGQETDGTVTPDDLGLGRMISRRKGDFVGKRSLSLADLCRPGRKQLVGLLPVDPAVILEEGAQLTEAGQAPSLGHVTSAYYSPSLGRGIALALLAGGRSRIGAQLRVPMPGRPIEVTVTEPVFLDRPPQRPVTRPSPLPLSPPVAQPAPVARPARTVRLAALAPATLLSVRAGPGAATAIGMAIGVLLPTVPCRSVIARERAALWLGPDEWLIKAPEGAVGLEALARRAPADRPASVVDVSQRTRTLELAGPLAAWCLNAFCALDLDIRAFPVGMCTRTLLGKAEVVLWRIAPEVFHVDVPRSLAAYAWACLEEARLEFAETAAVAENVPA
jgi:sarcosine oxidase subunit alpha